MSAKTPTIYVDMDDVLCHTARRFLDIVERQFGKQIAYDQLTDFDVGHACSLRPEEREELYRIVHESKELLNLQPIDAALDVLRQWQALGYDIAIVTGRPPESHDVSLEWLARHRVPYKNFTMVDKYGRFATENTVAITLAELSAREFCLAVEDSLPMAQYLAQRMAVPVALMDCPWNRGGMEHANISRCTNWQAVAAALPGRASSKYIGYPNVWLKVSRHFYEQRTLDVARQLLGKYLVRTHPDGITAGKIVETEAYIGPDDKACHASKGRTTRTEIMFGAAGHAYVYLIYGFHHMLNIVTEKSDFPAAVLIRAVEPVEGIELMQARRGTTQAHNLCSGPGKLCQAFAIDRALNGADICGSILYIEDRGENVARVATTARIGVDYAGRWKHKPWRFLIKNNAYVSKA